MVSGTLLSIEPLNDRISATSVTIGNTIRRRPDSHGRQHRRLRGLSNNRTVMQARRTVPETTGSSVGWSAIVVVFSATARAMPARLMSMPMPVAGDGVAGGRSRGRRPSCRNRCRNPSRVVASPELDT
jgi:hypothetical protein